jgi:uncharacterized protein
MSRPPKKRTVSFEPKVTLFIPSGVPRCRMDIVTFRTDEIEALRLTDMEGMYQGQAADVMGISRQTLGNILCSARRKVADALTRGKAIEIAADGETGKGRAFSETQGDCAREQGDGCSPHSGDGCKGHSANDCGQHQGAGCRD